MKTTASKLTLWGIVLLLFFFFTHQSHSNNFAIFKSGNNKLDSMLALLEKAKDDTNKVKLLVKISMEYLNANPDKGIEYAEKALKMGEKLNWKYGISDAYKCMGNNYFGKSDYKSALMYYQKSLKINEMLGDKFRIAVSLGNIGVMLFRLSDYPRALDTLQKALKLTEEIGYKKGTAVNLANIGIIYKLLSDYSKALEYYMKALKIDEEIGNKNGIASEQLNIGVIYIMLKNFPKGLEYSQKALKMYEQLGFKSGVANILGNIGIIHKELFEFDLALVYFQKAWNKYKEIKDSRGMANMLGSMGEIYCKMAKDSAKIDNTLRQKYLFKSEENLKKAISKFEELGEKNNQSKYLYSLSETYKVMGDWQKAYKTYFAHKTLADTIFSGETQKKIANLETKRELDLKQKELILLNKEKAYQRVLSRSLFGGLLLICMLLVLLFLFFQRKRKDNRLLTEKNEEISRQKETLQAVHNIIQKDIDNAKDYVLSLLPPKLDEGIIHTDWLYIPSAQLGGDLFGYHWIDNAHFAFYILDVCGHGTGSALHAVSVLHMIKSSQQLAVNPRNPVGVVSALNESFPMEEHGGLFFSIWYGVFDKNNGILEYVCAGHPAPLLFKDNENPEKLGFSEMTVGCYSKVIYTSHSMKLMGNSNILLFSDGVYEVRKADGETLKLSAFYEMLGNKPSNPAEIYQQITNLQNSKHFEDDFSILKISFSQPG